MKKIPLGTEGHSVMAGTLDELDGIVSCFVRLLEPVYMEDLTEVQVPTKVVFLILGPSVSILVNTQTYLTLKLLCVLCNIHNREGV